MALLLAPLVTAEAQTAPAAPAAPGAPSTPNPGNPSSPSDFYPDHWALAQGPTGGLSWRMVPRAFQPR